MVHHTKTYIPIHTRASQHGLIKNMFSISRLINVVCGCNDIEGFDMCIQVHPVRIWMFGSWQGSNGNVIGGMLLGGQAQVVAHALGVVVEV